MGRNLHSFHPGTDLISNFDNFVSSVISLKPKCVRIYMGRAKGSAVSVLPFGIPLLIIFKLLSTSPAFPAPENARFIIFTVLLDLSSLPHPAELHTEPLLNEHP